ncbi:MAG: OadG family protein [Saprospiraceae bacterium]
MESSLVEAFWLMIVGMGTVFFVLFLIGVCGRLLIKWVNTFQDVQISSKHSVHLQGDRIPVEHVAILSAVVEEITQGTGQIDQISKH